MAIVLASETKQEVAQERDSARRALRGLRQQLREQTRTVRDAGLAVGSAFACGYVREQRGEAAYQIMGYDASLVVGLAEMAIGLYQGGDAGEMLIASSVGVLADYAAREGAVIARERASGTVRGAQADYLREYAGQQP